MASFSKNKSRAPNLSTIEDGYSKSYSSSEGSLFSSSEANTHDDGMSHDRETIAGRENTAICCLRFIVILVILLAAILISIVIFIISKNSEEGNFENQYEAQSEQLLETFNSNVELKLGALESLAVSITSYTKDRNIEWPLLTVPDFAVRASATLELSDALNVALVPLVLASNRRIYEAYTQVNAEWIQEGLAFENQTYSGYGSSRNLQAENIPDYSLGFASSIYRMVEFQTKDGPPKQFPQVEDTEGPYLPVWQNFGIVTALVNYNLDSNENFTDSLEACLESDQAVLSRVTDLARDGPLAKAVLSIWEKDAGVHSGNPFSVINFPVFDSFASDRNLVAILNMVTYWSSYFDKVLPQEAKGLFAVVENECGQKYTYAVNGPEVTYVGVGDLHDVFFDYLERSTMVEIDRKGTQLNKDFCPYTIRVYPSSATRDIYVSNRPGIYTLSVVVVFIFTIGMFIVYDCIVERRQRVVMRTAVENRAIVASLFPSAVRERLFNNDKAEQKKNDLPHGGVGIGIGGTGMAGMDQNKRTLNNGTLVNINNINNPSESAPLRIKNFLNDTPESFAGQDEKPIADLFPNCTVYFADIAGFTAWSSQREPTQVFTLLQTLYQAFDKIAKKLGVFKIETIGDCYVAVTGLPEPQADHAVRMARFARECLHKMYDLVRQLEISLGPGTGDLSLRTGMHSGAVTAGVLRGEKSRFQLFGDTVNTASRMESSGERNKIQCSITTADLLRAADKGSWLTSREDLVVAKGKGEMQTYWVRPRTGGNFANASDHLRLGGSDHMRGSDHNETEPIAPNGDNDPPKKDGSSKSFASQGSGGASKPAEVTPVWSAKMLQGSQKGSDVEKNNRLIDWHMDLLGRLLKQIVARRRASASEKAQPEPPTWQGSGRLVADEVAEFISFPTFDPHLANIQRDADSIELDSSVVSQLRDFVTKVAGMYRNNPFHNFEHASHITMSTNKLFNRIVRPVIRSESERQDSSETLEYTSRITSDPLTHFSVILAALIHDVDHTGVSNMDLIREKAEIAALYNNKSVAEQNSVDVAWELLMDPSYSDLQSCIYQDQTELCRFRQIVVNMVMATDIFDKGAKAVRETRWQQAFGSAAPSLSEDQLQNLRATVMLEHTIQASDVGHAMQHWQVFIKWNERLLEEMMSAYESGRAPNDPSGGWYEGEIMFFDFYIIPLARKLLDSGAYGVAGDEYLNYALENRAQWGAKGANTVAEMASRYHEARLRATLPGRPSDRKKAHSGSAA